MNARSLSLYVHIPFCRAKCSYCDFNSYAGLEWFVPSYVDALLAEMALWRQLIQDMSVATVFFGGGTPSLLPLPQVERIVAALRQHLCLATAAEVSFEANPGTVDRAYLSGLLRLGVNRLSLGVQSFQDDELCTLGRIHTAEEAREAFRLARQAGFANVNLDLIYGLPRQTLAGWQRTLNEAIALGPDHLSLYALTLEEGTRLAEDVACGRLPQPDADLAADMYVWAEEALAAAAYQHYEISNWALPGGRCRHNLTYWLNRPYLGLGAGAHSHLGESWEQGTKNKGCRFANVRDPREYVRLVKEGAEPQRAADGLASSSFASLRTSLAGLLQVILAEEVSTAQAMAETAVLGLRLVEGLSLVEFRRRFGQELMAAYGPQVEELETLGLLERANGCLRLTPRGRLLGNEVFLRFLPDT